MSRNFFVIVPISLDVHWSVAKRPLACTTHRQCVVESDSCTCVAKSARRQRTHLIEAPANEIETWLDASVHVGDALHANVTFAAAPQQFALSTASFDEPVSAIRRNVFYHMRTDTHERC